MAQTLRKCNTLLLYTHKILLEGTSTQIKHCVRAIAKEMKGSASERTSSAFAICVSQFQKNGFLKKGSTELTAKGKENEKKHDAEQEVGKKLKEYEKLLKLAKKSRARKRSKV